MILQRPEWYVGVVSEPLPVDGVDVGKAVQSCGQWAAIDVGSDNRLLGGHCRWVVSQQQGAENGSRAPLGGHSGGHLSTLLLQIAVGLKRLRWK